MLLTAEQFKACFPGNKEPAEWAGALNAILPGYGINTPLRVAAFLAQCGHESEGLTRLVENLNYSAAALAATWPKRFPPEVAAQYARQPERIANRAYANRLGNGPEESGDGWMYRGRGPIQATGKDHYADFAKRTGRTLAEAVEYMTTKAGGLEFACMFWNDNGLSPLADEGKMTAITKIVNGGTNGLEDRLARYERVKEVFA